MMNVIAQPDARDWYALPAEETDYTTEPDSTCEGLKIAYSENLGLPDASVAVDVQRAVENAVGVFQKLGAVVEPGDPPAIPKCRDVFRVMWASFAAKVADDVGERRPLLDPSLDRLAQRGEALSRETFVNAVIARGEIGAEIKQFFGRYDLVISPVFQSTAPSLAECERSGPPIPDYKNWCNLSGIPAASVFCGLSKDGLPIGLQIAGGPFADSQVLSVCGAFERAFGRAPRPSQLF
jgi:aspartyl-tRNA(Asn)/glutamyl-tRNA(Gln) amidotransferase subunit A